MNIFVQKSVFLKIAESHNVLIEAVRLLVDIAGAEPVHIEMSARGPKKYYDVHRMFGERDGRAHLLGYRTKGATLRHPDGMTRALCFDADTPRHWLLLQEAAQVLAETGSIPLLEVSPVGRGGHLWIIYSDLIFAAQARRHALELAPRLGDIAESWPESGPRTSKVRLPGGKYVQPGFNKWCTLTDAQGTLQLEQNGMAFSPAVPERTPSTALTKESRARVDFSTQSRQPDGGDALELAARAGESTPSWVIQIIAEAGWQHYRSLRAKSMASRTASGG